MNENQDYVNKYLPNKLYIFVYLVVVVGIPTYVYKNVKCSTQFIWQLK